MIAESWAELGAVFRRPAGRVVRGEAREAFSRRFDEIARKEAALDDRLFIGLVGGTGVGKSTLINALAGEVISRSGDRRPTTDRAVLYRHRDERLPASFPREDLSTPERSHDNDALRRLILVDFPDFDSVEVDHAAILTRCLPHLDITFVVIDESKYGDQRLYEVLRGFPQDPANLYFIFNKIDELVTRYGDSSPAVADEILCDLAGKVETYAGWTPRPEHRIAISALEILQGRLGDSGAAAPTGAPSQGGEFEAIERVLTEYRSEKRRLAAKRLNLDHLKRSFVDDVLDAFVDGQPLEWAEEAERKLTRGIEEVSAVLAATPREVLGTGERAALRAGAIRRLRPQLGFPMDLLFIALGEWRHRKFGGRDDVTTHLRDRLREHYRAARESLEVFEKRQHLEIGDVLSPAPDDGTRPDDSSDRPLALDEEIEARTGSTLKGRFRRNHLLPALGLVGLVWYLLQPIIASALDGLGGESSFFAVVWEVLVSFVKAINPFFVIGGLILILFLYALAAILLWSRLAHAVERVIVALESSERERVRLRIETRRLAHQEAIDEWKDERTEISQIAEEARPSDGTAEQD